MELSIFSTIFELSTPKNIRIDIWIKLLAQGRARIEANSLTRDQKRYQVLIFQSKISRKLLDRERSIFFCNKIFQ